MLKKFIISIVMTLGFSVGANATLSTADAYLTSANTNAAYSHWYALRSFFYNNAGYSSQGRSYAVSSRNAARNAFLEAADSYDFSGTSGAYYARQTAYSTYLNTYYAVTYWYSNKPAAFNYARTADLKRADAIGWVNFEWGLNGNY